jgi:predicted Zn-dependent protease
MGIDSESASTVENPSPGLEQSSSGPSPETRYEEALRAMLGSKYQHATEIFLALIAQSPQEIRYQTALELARGHLARNAGRNQEALEYFHRVCVLDGSCADAIQAIQALTTQATDGEEQLLDRLLGDGR